MYQKLRDLTAPLVRPLTVQGLHGRVLTHPSRRDGAGRTIVFVYGIHGSLERFYGVIHYFARFGTVVVPDLPGFGGMETFYKLGRRPSLDAYGDYLADFINQELPEGKLTLVGLSYGFVVITRMLVRHPELAGRVTMVLSVMGLAGGRDFAMKPWLRRTLGFAFGLGKRRPLCWMAQYVFTRRWVLKLSYRESHPKMQALTAAERPEFIDFEAYLWRCNDMRTYCACIEELSTFSQTGDHVALTVHHVETANDHWLNVPAAQAHITELYDKLVVHKSELRHHGGTAYADESEPEVMIPATVRTMLEAA